MIVKFMPSQLPVLQIFHRLVYNIVLLLLVISVFAHLIHDGLDMFGRLLKNFLHLVEHRCNFTQRVLLVVTQANEPLLCHTILQNLEQLWLVLLYAFPDSLILVLPLITLLFKISRLSLQDFETVLNHGNFNGSLAAKLAWSKRVARLHGLGIIKAVATSGGLGLLYCTASIDAFHLTLRW